MTKILFITSLVSLTFSSTLCLQCLDSNGNFVDWYSTYKAPEIREQSSLFKLGVAHYYLDVNSPKWSLSQRSINDSSTAVYNTLQQVYTSASQNAEAMYLMYNDEHPHESISSGGGHTKGVVSFDGKSGFWLIHSVPKFPPNQKDGYSYPHTGTRYGQTFLCISMPYGMLGQVAKQLLYNQPSIYDYYVPQSMMKDFSILHDIINHRKPPGPPWYSVLDIQSVKGQKFTSFAKSSYYGRDLYTDLVAPRLEESLLVETWMDGEGHVLSNNCSVEYKIYNAKLIRLPGDVLFKRSRDHSKWAVANLDSLSHDGGSWTCIGDINRMQSQFKRGGGTVCIDNAGLWKTFRASVDDYEHCR